MHPWEILESDARQHNSGHLKPQTQTFPQMRSVAALAEASQKKAGHRQVSQLLLVSESWSNRQYRDHRNGCWELTQAWTLKRLKCHPLVKVSAFSRYSFRFPWMPLTSTCMSVERFGTRSCWFFYVFLVFPKADHHFHWNYRHRILLVPSCWYWYGFVHPA